MDIEGPSVAKADLYLEHLIERDPMYLDEARDLVLFLHYGQDVHSQFGLGFHGFVARQKGRSTQMSVKVSDGGVPLVAFSTQATTTSCIQQYLNALEDGRVRWMKDKFPWI